MYSQCLQFSLRHPAWLAAFISLLLSTLNVINDDSINSDGILYVEAAKLFLEQGWQASVAHYKWAFYQILIAIVSKVTFLGLEHAAYVLNAALLAGLAFAFIRCSEYLFDDKRISIAALILFITHLSINEYRDLIIRDFGYWCFFFVAFLMLLKFYKYRQHRYLVFYTTSMLVATLFRIEGIIFTVLVPLILLKNNSISLLSSLRLVFIAWSPLVILSMMGLLILWGSDGAPDFGRLYEPFSHLTNVISNLVSGIQEKGRILEETVLDINTRNMGTQSFIGILLMMLMAKLFSATSLIPSLLALRTLFTSYLRGRIDYFPVLLWFIILYVVVLSGFVVSTFFLSGRYAIVFSLLMYLPAAVALAHIFRKGGVDSEGKPSAKLKTLRIVIVVALIYMLLDGVTSFSAGKMYRRDAADWINNNVALDEKLLSNDELMFYYSGRFMPRNEFSEIYNKTRFSELPTAVLTEYDVVAINIGRKQLAYKDKIIAWVGSEPVFQTENRKGASVLIFRLKK